eukprot:1196083-Prorocentrum_minimum.AAC.4
MPEASSKPFTASTSSSASPSSTASFSVFRFLPLFGVLAVTVLSRDPRRGPSQTTSVSLSSPTPDAPAPALVTSAATCAPAGVPPGGSVTILMQSVEFRCKPLLWSVDLLRVCIYSIAVQSRTRQGVDK